METGQILHGFEIKRIRTEREIGGSLIEMKHIASGAELCWLDNGQENKLFSIAFKTIPYDNSGVFHILEHSVLCGSQKYPVKEPFVELLKSSMNTFLNAMTGPDLTVFPVSSRNDRDLMNLTTVYLDAVFAPAILNDNRIFAQEGYHIETDENGSGSYKGVVFNEMKGALGETDQLIDRTITKMLFRDNCYGFNAGGDPEAITDLTCAQFIDAYKKFYHPANSRIYLDGDIKINEMLELIDSYLSRYSNAAPLVPEIEKQIPYSSEKTIFYEIGKDEEIEDKAKLTIGRIVSGWNEKKKNIAISIICDALTGSNDAPLKRAVLDEGLAQDISMSIDDTIAQAYLTIHAENISEGSETMLIEAIDRIGADIRENGLDHESLEASLNRIAFHLKEGEEPQALGRNFRVLGSWLYGGDPMYLLQLDDTISELRRMIIDGELDGIAADLLTNHDCQAVLHTYPSYNAGEKMREDEARKIKNTIAEWSDAEYRQQTAFCKALSEWQNSPDSPENLAGLPKLTLKDTDRNIPWMDTEEAFYNGARILRHSTECGGIVYVDMFFPVTDLTLDEIGPLTLIGNLFGELSTEKHDALSLQKTIKRLTGRLNFDVATRGSALKPDVCTPYLGVSFSTLKENLTETFGLVGEILLQTQFEQHEPIREIIMQCEMSARQRGPGAGHAIGIRDVLSHYTADGAVREVLEGATAIRYIHDFAGNFEDRIDSFVRLIRKTVTDAVCRKRLTVGITSDDPVDPAVFIDMLPEGHEVPPDAHYERVSPEKRAYLIPAQIGYAVKGYNINRIGQKFDGSMCIAANILSLDYLWNTVRVKGGAYGAGLRADRAGNVFMYSYRDPTPCKTIEAAGGISGYLRDFNECELEKYIISTINEINPLLSSREKGSLATLRFLNGYSYEDAETLYREVIGTTYEKLCECAEKLTAFAQNGAVCVVAHRDAAGDTLFDEISEL